MASSEVEIWNLAISAAQGRGAISDPDERGREADLCRIWYPLIRDSVMKAASWPCANRYSRLALLTERVDSADWTASAPAPTWRYAYAEPSDMLAPRYLVDYSRFSRGRVADSAAIFCNTEQAILYYTAVVPDITTWDTGLLNAIIHTLAASLVIPLSGKITLSDRLYARANEIVLLARTEAANEAEDNFEQLPSWIAQRGFSGSPRPDQFIWPYEAFAVRTS